MEDATRGWEVIMLGSDERRISGGGGPGAAALLSGGVMAALTGVLAIKTFLKMLDRNAFHLFAPYCWLAGGGFLTHLWMR